MIERWLAKELIRKDPYLDGFWALSKNLSDMSGRGKHAIHGAAFSTNPETPNFYPRKVLQCNGRSGSYFTNVDMLYAGNVADFNYFISQPFTVSVWFCRVINFYADNNQIPLIGKTSRTESELPYSSGWDLTIKPYLNGEVYGTAMQFRHMTDTFYGYGIGVYAELEPFHEQGLGRWHHLLVVKPNHKAENISVYYDGRPIPVTITHDYFDQKGGSVTNRLWFGMKWEEQSYATVVTAPVLMDLVRVWKKELTAKEASDVYERELMAYDFRRAIAGFTPPMTAPVELFVSGFDVKNRSVPLYISTIDYIYTNPVPLVITGVPDTASMPLYTSGILSQTNNTTLYTFGSPFFNTTPLFISGVLSENRSLPLYMHVKNALPLSGSGTLFVNGSTTPGMVDTIPLYTSGTGPYTDRMMNLFLLGHPSDLTVRNMNLWVNGTNEVVPNSITLFLKNTQEGVEGSTTLFIEAPGGVALSEDMNLFLKRPFEEMVTLFVEGPGTELVSPTMTLYTQSANTIQDDMTLVMPNTFGVLNPKMTLFVRGW